MYSNQSNKDNISLISDIISNSDNSEKLQSIFKNNPNWEQIICISSEHLLLPALYTKILNKGLVSYIPNDLNNYLKEITSINKNRNAALLDEAVEINRLLTKHNINFVFIKGIALLASGLYKINNERMIGDIDLLVDTDQCQQAFDILIANGYDDLIEFNYKTKGFRHMPRQVNTNKIGAVEIHRHVLDNRYKKYICAKNVIENKDINSSLPVPSYRNQLCIAIYAEQINNQTYYFNTINLKTVLDVLEICKIIDVNLENTLNTDKYVKKFFTISGCLFPELRLDTFNETNAFYRSLFKLSNTYPKLGSTMFAAKSIFLAIKTRTNLFFCNKSYRKHVIANKL